MIEGEASTLEENIHSFAARMDERREIIVQAFEYYQKAEIVRFKWGQSPGINDWWPLCLNVRLPSKTQSLGTG